MKTIGPVSSILIASLGKKDKVFFSLKEAAAIIKKTPQNASDILCELVKKGLVGRIKAGRFFLIPLEAGENYTENLYLVARELLRPVPYYLSHLTAMAVYGMTSQPSKSIFVSCSKRFSSKEINKVLYGFVYCPKKKFWGITDAWVTKQEKIKVSDPEKTIINCLERPDLCAGISEIVKGVYYKRQTVSYERLCKYAKKTGIKAVIKRLGFILELLKLGSAKIIDNLKDSIKHDKTYIKLDPSIDKIGKYDSRWKLILNITAEELKGIITT